MLQGPHPKLRRSFRLATLAGLAWLWLAWGSASAQRDEAPEGPGVDPEAVLRDMSPEERVGQLFLVAFYAPPESDEPLGDLRALIREQKVGGVVLQKSSLAFSNRAGEDLPAQVARLNEDLQSLALSPEGSGVPLFIAVDHEGDGDPRSHLREGFTALPSQMALGATWDPEAAETAGRIAGAELAAVGVNLLLGPVMDVLSDPRVDSGGDIGIRAYGGHPYWVARMGLAYIRGLQEGSQGRVAAVAKHFPGHGGSDRNPDQRAGTVFKSLSELQRVELPPFAAITDPEAPTVVEALMTSHIRYSGFQGPNIQDITPPVSFDQASLRSILELPSFRFEDWRRGGGLIVADALGVNAVKYYFDPSGERFNPREVARQAFWAGNDLLIISQFGIGSEGGVAWSEQLENLQTAVRYFSDQYRRDERFRDRVDEAALRILRRKAALNPRWTPEALAARPADLAGVGSSASRQAVESIARRGLTVLRSIRRPEPGERIVVVTQDPISPNDDANRPLACPQETCGLDRARWERLRAMGPTLVEAMILEGYGPGGSGTVDPASLRSMTFCQLETALSPPVALEEPQDSLQPEEDPPEDAPGSGPTRSRSGCLDPADRATMLADLSAADWILFAVSDLGTREQVSVLNGFFLRQLDRLSLTRARLGLLAFGAPYYLDATNFTRLDYFAVAYSKIPASIEAAVDALFDPLWSPEGRANLPVTYEDAGYVLDERLAADPSVGLDLRAIGDLQAGAPVGPVTIEVGPVIDHNGNQVPDGTVVEVSSVPAEALADGPVSLLTRGGMARSELRLRGGGDVALRARAGDATSQALRLLLPTATASPTATPAVDEPSSEAGPQVTERVLHEPRPADLLLSLAAIVLALALTAGLPGWTAKGTEIQLRSLLANAAGGLIGYLLWALASPRARVPEALWASSAGAVGLAVLGSVIGAVVALAPDLIGSAPARPGRAR